MLLLLLLRCSIHDDMARKLAVKFLIGRLEGASPPHHADQASAKATQRAASGDHQVAFSPRRRQPFKLVEKQNVSHDTRLFRWGVTMCLGSTKGRRQRKGCMAAMSSYVSNITVCLKGCMDKRLPWCHAS